MPPTQSIFRGAKQRSKADARESVQSIAHHLHILSRLSQLEAEGDEDELLEYHAIYGPKALFKREVKAIEHEVMALGDVYSVDSETHTSIQKGLTASSECIAFEVNFGTHHTTGVEFHTGNMHAATEVGFTLGSGTTNRFKAKSVERIGEDCTADLRDCAIVFAFTAREETLHVGFDTYDRANEAVLNLAESRIKRIVGL